MYEPFLAPNFTVVDYIQDKIDKPVSGVLIESIEELESLIRNKVCVCGFCEVKTFYCDSAVHAETYRSLHPRHFHVLLFVLSTSHLGHFSDGVASVISGSLLHSLLDSFTFMCSCIH